MTHSGNQIRQSEIWILGGGKFGLKSARTLRRLHPAADITVVDRDTDICRNLEALSFKTVCLDGVAFLVQSLKASSFPEWIVPVIPVHVAYEWIRTRLSSSHRIESFPVPDPVVNQVPHPMPGPKGEIFMSLADFVCPENCPEPSKICTYTGKPRPFRLFEKLSGISFENYLSVVVQSRQLSPGVGGFRPTALFEALDAVESANRPVLLSTACSCHGVMHALRVVPKLLCS